MEEMRNYLFPVLSFDLLGNAFHSSNDNPMWVSGRSMWKQALARGLASLASWREGVVHSCLNHGWHGEKDVGDVDTNLPVQICDILVRRSRLG